MQTIVKATLVPGGSDNLRVAQYYSNVPGYGNYWEVTSDNELYGGYPVIEFRTSLLEKKFGFSRYDVDEQFVIECAMLVALEADANSRKTDKTDLGLSIW